MDVCQNGGSMANKKAGKVEKMMDLDEKVEYWHTHETGMELREFLGLTPDEYIKWVKNETEI